jgi:hypothetical protein
MTDQSTTDDIDTTAASTDYKILGEDDYPDGAGILGKNTANTGTPIGVEGAVPNTNTGYGLATPDDAKISGDLTTENWFRVNIDGNANIFHGSDNANGTAGGVILGHSSNNTSTDDLDDPVEGATIAGGGFDDGEFSDPNTVVDNFGTVSGGRNNQAGSDDDDVTNAEYATVGGGDGNTASGAKSAISGGTKNEASNFRATVGGGGNNTATGRESAVGGGGQNDATADNATVAGGTSNTASGEYSTVGGGWFNTASGKDSTVPGGENGAAESDNSFVWNDGSSYHSIPNSSFGLSSAKAVDSESVTGAGTFSVSASGGVRFITGSSSVTYISSGSTGWSNTSSRAAKTNIDSVAPQQVLDGVEDLEVATWEYKDDDGEGAGTTHIGPMAEEFHDIVAVGSSDEHINSINADGVLFAAVQGLSERLAEKDDRIADLEADRDDLQAENEHLRDRLARIEDHLGLDSTVDPVPADD